MPLQLVKLVDKVLTFLKCGNISELLQVLLLMKLHVKTRLLANYVMQGWNVEHSHWSEHFLN